MDTRITERDIEPFYFGKTGKQLFGCFHSPLLRSTRDCGVVLCYPMGQEHISSHRAYQQLANRLARVGFPVLRFDYYGCGDSAGTRTEGEICQWLGDISTAISEIRQRCGCGQVCLMGLRLGGTLAMMVAAERNDIDSLVLWEPVVSGMAYVQELIAMHEDMVRRSHILPDRYVTDKKPSEIIGFPLTDGLLAELNSLDLLATQQKPARNVLLIEQSETLVGGQFRAHLQSYDARVAYRHLPGQRFWEEVILNRITVPIQIFQAVITWMTEVYP